MIATLPYLQVGMRVLWEGRVHEVVKVNDCCARIVPVEKAVRTFVPRTGKDAGRPLCISVKLPGHNISPNSELPIV